MIRNIVEQNRKGLIAICGMCLCLYLVTGLTMHVLMKQRHEYNRLSMFGRKSAYAVVDSTSEEDMDRILSNSRAVEVLSGFFRDLCRNDISFITEFSYDMFRIDGMKELVRYQTVTDGFFELFGISARAGSLFSEEDYSEQSEIVPVIVGYELKDTYLLNQIYEFELPYSENGFRGKVIGVLDKNSTFFRYSSMAIDHSLDYSYIVPLGESRFKEELGLGSYDMALNHTLFFLNQEGEADGINQKLISMNLFRTELSNASKEMGYYLKEQKQTRILAIAAIGTITVLFFLGFLSVILKIISKQSVEIAARVMSGASRLVLAGQLLVPASTIMILTGIAAGVLFHTKEVILVYVGLFGGLVALYSFIIYAKLRHLSLIPVLEKR